jgi:hypothetical protein
MIYLSIATEILIFSYFASFKLSTMVLSIAANYTKQITATKPTLLHSKLVFKQITYKFIVNELQSNKFWRGGGRHLIISREDQAGGEMKRGRWGPKEVVAQGIDGQARIANRRRGRWPGVWASGWARTVIGWPDG